jgi:hypothetical protein
MRKIKQLSNSNHIHRKQSPTDFVGFDFSITGKTKNGEKLTATIPAGMSRKHLKDFFKIIGYPPFLYNGNS